MIFYHGSGRGYQKRKENHEIGETGETELRSSPPRVSHTVSYQSTPVVAQNQRYISLYYRVNQTPAWCLVRLIIRAESGH